MASNVGGCIRSVRIDGGWRRGSVLCRTEPVQPDLFGWALTAMSVSSDYLLPVGDPLGFDLPPGAGSLLSDGRETANLRLHWALMAVAAASASPTYLASWGI